MEAPHVLIAYDGSEPARRTVERVATFMPQANVAIVTVVDPIYRDPPYTGYADPKEEEQHRAALAEAQEVLRKSGIEDQARSSVLVVRPGQT